MKDLIAFGLGSIITLIIIWIFWRRKRNKNRNIILQDLEEAYVFLEAARTKINKYPYHYQEQLNNDILDAQQMVQDTIELIQTEEYLIRDKGFNPQRMIVPPPKTNSDQGLTYDPRTREWTDEDHESGNLH